MSPQTLRKFEALRRQLGTMESLVVGYSGGVDSALLVRIAHDVLGDRMLAVLADSPSLPRREFREALDLVRSAGIPVDVVRTREMEDDRYRANPENRCYFCKSELFEQMQRVARERGFGTLAHGENADDAGDWRPGSKAAAEMRVVAPLRDAGLTKQEIREISRELGLPTWDKPAMACLASRVPYRQPVTAEKLRMIEEAESVLAGLGLREIRVRHHEDALARIEVGAPEISRFLDPRVRADVVRGLKEVGYTYVAVDLEGYRRGSLNVPAGS